MDEDRVVGEELHERRDRSGDQRHGGVTGQAPRDKRHQRYRGDAADERHELQRPFGIRKESVHPAPDDERAGRNMDRRGHHVEEPLGPDDGTVDQVVVPERRRIQAGKARRRRADHYRAPRKHQPRP